MFGITRIPGTRPRAALRGRLWREGPTKKRPDYFAAAFGKMMRIVVPWPTTLWASTRPPCSCTICFTMDLAQHFHLCTSASRATGGFVRRSPLASGATGSFKNWAWLRSIFFLVLAAVVISSADHRNSGLPNPVRFAPFLDPRLALHCKTGEWNRFQTRPRNCLSTCRTKSIRARRNSF